MSTELRVVPAQREEVTALVQTCTDLATQSRIDHYELAVKSRLEAGIKDDNELRKTDELLREVVRGMDDLEAGTKSPISEAYALHKGLIAVVKPWRERWDGLRNSLAGLILKYNNAKEDLAKRQQEEVNRATEEERQRKAAEAKALMREGDVAGARAAMSQANTMVTSIISQARPVLSYSSPRKPWQAEITDPELTVLGIAAGLFRQMDDERRADWLRAITNGTTLAIPISVIKEWDLGFIKKEATKRGGLTWPGIKAWQEDKLNVSRR